ncbi:MAG: 23S rRNA (adenine(2503)-C(2))-methyltransferase RlmN [Candidatus Omnitrophica bacterium]|nr:23S rRNA (adenine(2503)-C(2))-methyltransferase RlmN [Candidatus Omnitrophota bacterium]
MNRIRIKDLSAQELGHALEEANNPSYRARQIFRWLYKDGVGSFDQMTDIPAPLRSALDSKFRISFSEAIDLKRSLSDGTTKYLFRLEDANTIETVLIPEGERNTICLSSQVGCKFACGFCASAPFGFVRNLSQAEIIDEAIAVKKANAGISINNLVFMGIGEPFDNYDNVLRAIRVFNHRDAFNIGARKITISTCGIVPGIEALAKEGMQLELSVSLHAADDGIRSKILPVNKRYPLKDLIAACKDYIRATNRIITFEYVLISGVNSSGEDAAKLAGLLKRIKCKVNVISYNKVPGRPYETPSESETRIFMKALKDSGLNAIHRKPKGEDIDAGCGQLRISRLR